MSESTTPPTEDAWIVPPQDAAAGAVPQAPRPHPGAAGALREGLDETLTLQRLGATGALYRTLRSTNAIENLNGLVGHFVRNVHCWRNGRMLVRWIAAGLRESTRSFRRLRGHRDLAALIRALDRTAMDSRKEVA
jgi:hypothetical protein